MLGVLKSYWQRFLNHFKEREFTVSFEEQMEWIVDVESLLKQFAGTEHQRHLVSEKAMLFKRGLRHGTVFFIEENFPSTQLPDWYWHQVRTRNPDNHRAREAREEREAFFYLVNEIKDLKEKHL